MSYGLIGLLRSCRSLQHSQQESGRHAYVNEKSLMLLHFTSHVCALAVNSARAALPKDHWQCLQVLACWHTSQDLHKTGTKHIALLQHFVTKDVSILAMADGLLRGLYVPHNCMQCLSVS